MNATIIAALIGLAGIIIGAILKEVLPGSLVVQWFSRTAKGHNLVGEWDSSWKTLPDGQLTYHEVLKIDRQRGVRISGTVLRDEQPDKKWEVEGRYDGMFLQMYYYPSRSSKNVDFLDYGCYFLKRKADGSFEGYSTGFGTYDEEISKEGITTDYHVLKRR